MRFIPPSVQRICVKPVRKAEGAAVATVQAPPVPVPRVIQSFDGPPRFSFMIPNTPICDVEPLSIPTANKGFNHGSAPLGHMCYAARRHMCELCIYCKN